MSIFDPPLPFDPTKPFYPLVVSYVVQVHGFIELASRGLVSKLENVSQEEIERYISLEPDEKVREALKAAYRGGKTGLFGKQQLESKVTGQGVNINVELLANELFDNYEAPLGYFNRMTAGALLILAGEITHSYHTHDPLWEFLRHCRNAAGHKGFFNFLHGEPRRPAKWRRLEIRSSLQGQPLFFDPPIPGFIGSGDTLYLLWDIEQAYPKIR